MLRNNEAVLNRKLIHGPGVIPESIGALTNLTYISIAENNLAGKDAKLIVLAFFC